MIISCVATSGRAKPATSRSHGPAHRVWMAEPLANPNSVIGATRQNRRSR